MRSKAYVVILHFYYSYIGQILETNTLFYIRSGFRCS